ncbi:MAG: flagellar biosynthesis protein FlhB [Candidatus Sericytochromatia bacterium]|nr:flagellar biosynthesis protein FlhB [Candidatus Sericytochromatia bacterium]
MADEKTEDPTPKRRSEARQKGQVLKSKEVNIAVMLLVMVYALKWFGPMTYRRLFRWFTYIFSEAGTHPVTVAGVHQLGLQGAYTLIMCLLPLFIAMYITAAGIELLQVGLLITGKPLKPQFERINPLKGVKRIVSLKSIVEFIKGLFKTFFVGYFVFKTIKENIPHIMMTMQDPLDATFAFVGQLIIIIAKRVALAMICLAGVDYFYQRWEFEKSLKMSKQEVKDEYKQAEGDPHVKGKIRQKMRQMARGAAKQAVQDSSAVVTNPTHYAVAIKYVQGMDAPIIMAKGEGHMALYIKKLADEHDIPMFEDVELARALFKIGEVEKPIPPELYMAVAKIIAEIMKAKVKRNPKGAAQDRPARPFEMPAAVRPPIIDGPGAGPSQPSGSP